MNTISTEKCEVKDVGVQTEVSCPPNSLLFFCTDNLLFASIISAVDPVAALNAFEDTGVNEQIYIVIFGEGLFNDAVTVVLYSMFAFLADMPNIDSVDVFLGVAWFFVVGMGGVFSGLLFGFVAAFVTFHPQCPRDRAPLCLHVQLPFVLSCLPYPASWPLFHNRARVELGLHPVYAAVRLRLERHRDEMKETSRPKKKFLTADVRKMHDLLAKNMYKIRHRTMAYTNKYTLPYHSETREILIRRHASIRRSLRAESFQSGAFLRSSSCSLVTAKKLNTIKELGSPGESPAVSANSLAEYPSVTILDERASRRAKKAPVPVPGRRSSKPEDEENVDSEHLGRGRGGEEPVRPPPLSPPGCLRVESREKMRQETHCSDTRHKDLEEQGDHD
ncbi:unnamed protein product [Oreochromis niloticus]|nr:unnamed protein product [Mustela putorius furo]